MEPAGSVARVRLRLLSTKHPRWEGLIVGLTIATLAALLFSLRSGRISERTLSLGVASSLRPVLPAIESAGKTGETRVKAVLTSSGRIANQLAAGASFDAVLLADGEAVDRLEAADLVDGATRRELAGNRLVLVAPESTTTPTSLGDLGSLRVALGEPATVPLGAFAAEALAGAGVPRPRSVVYGASAEQVLGYARTGTVDAAIVYATDFRRAGAGLRLVEQIDPSLHRPIKCVGAVTTAARKPDAAAALLDRLGEREAQEAFRAAGFAPPPAAAR